MTTPNPYQQVSPSQPPAPPGEPAGGPLPPLPERPRKSWMGRNWPWLVPVGCLGSIAIVVVFIVSIVGLVFGMLKSNDAYKQGFAQASSHPVVIERLGEPIEAGWLVSGQINVSGGSGHANLSIPISGPKGGATVYVKATKSAGEWTLTCLVVKIDRTGERIELVTEPATQPAPPP
ncbi:MAG TPA: cytochrome c oxidase assembly factor Coa1 family protein [Phycisphaerae bacterium]|nr:cytochrome c oxidase assembly factor Coa1 family protein [Phycisphaerae bacterium]